MDRKRLLFIACFSGIFFVLNLFLGQLSIKQKADKLSRQKQTEQTLTPLSALSGGANNGLSPSAVEGDHGNDLYVLENQSLQLVIDSKGGNLIEINLPLKSKKAPKSVIKPVEFDARVERQSPKNAYFPLVNSSGKIFRCSSEEKSQTVTAQLGGYYPLLRRTQVGGLFSTTAQPSSGQIFSSQLQLDKLIFRPHQMSDTRLVLRAQTGLRNIVKTFTLSTTSNCFEIETDVGGDCDDLWISSGVPEVEMLSGASTPQIKYQIEKSGKPSTVKASLPSKISMIDSLRPDWICNSNGFFGLIMRPLTSVKSGFRIEKLSGVQVPSRLNFLDQEWNRFPLEKFPGYQVYMPLSPKGEKAVYQFFAGPLSQTLLSEIDHTFAKQESKINPHFSSSQSFHGWFAFISQPFAKLLMLLMNGFYKITRSWAISICLLTVALRVMLYPLNSWSMISTQRMRELAPLIQRAQEKYKKEPQKAQKEVLQLYRDNNINPLSGCLPLLLQMPFLIGMFDLLKSSFELRGASFIPGWIDDLSAPDVLFTWPTSIPFFGHELHVLPLLVGLAMYWQQMINSPKNSDDQGMSEQQKQQKTIGNVMTLVFAAMFYHFPSGLNIYWLSSILLGIGQQAWFQKAAATPVVITNSAK